MKGDAEVIKLLNGQLNSEFTAIMQYILHSKMQENWGYTEMATRTHDAALEEMKHADMLTERILFLDGKPDFSSPKAPKIGGTVREQLEADRQAEMDAITYLQPAIVKAQPKDMVTAALLETIITTQQAHLNFVETQLELMDALGEPLYLSKLTD